MKCSSSLILRNRGGTFLIPESTPPLLSPSSFVFLQKGKFALSYLPIATLSLTFSYFPLKSKRLGNRKQRTKLGFSFLLFLVFFLFSSLLLIRALLIHFNVNSLALLLVFLLLQKIFKLCVVKELKLAIRNFSIWWCLEVFFSSYFHLYSHIGNGNKRKIE